MRFLFAATLFLWPLFASAQNYPTRSITLIVPFAAGGPTDTIARVLAERIQPRLGQPVTTENVTGAAGTIAGTRVARANPDGYTLLIGHWGTHVLNGALYDLQYDLVRDFEPIVWLATGPQIIVARPTIPANNLQELIAWLKANPDKASAGWAGAGSHVAEVFFRRMTGTKFNFVPYRGAGPALNDLMAGHIDLMLDQATNSLPQVRGGTVKGFAVTAATRLTSAPEIPTVDEAGLPGLYISYWHGLWAPRGTPQEIIAKINDAVVEALTNDTLRRKLIDLGQEISASDQQTPAALRKLQEAEIARWWPIIKAENIKAE